MKLPVAALPVSQSDYWLGPHKDWLYPPCVLHFKEDVIFIFASPNLIMTQTRFRAMNNRPFPRPTKKTAPKKLGSTPSSEKHSPIDQFAKT